MVNVLPWPRVRGAFALSFVAAISLLTASCGGHNSSPTPPPSHLATCSSNNQECRDVVVNGITRSYVLHVPAGFKANSGALVVVLAGSGGHGADTAVYTQMTVKADTTGFAVAYPDSLVAPGARTTKWHNYFDDSLWAPETPPDDVAFMRQLLGAVEAEIHPDPKRIYFAGISNGGFFAHRVGIEMSDVVASIGIVEGTLYGFSGNLQGIPAAKAPVSVLIIHGDADSTIPYCAQMGVASQELTFNYWVQTPAMSCKTVSSNLPLCDAQGSVTSLSDKDATGCSGGAEIEFYKLIGGIHSWYNIPMNVEGQVPYNPALDSTTGVTTNDILWNFFAAHPKP